MQDPITGKTVVSNQYRDSLDEVKYSLTSDSLSMSNTIRVQLQRKIADPDPASNCWNIFKRGALL